MNTLKKKKERKDVARTKKKKKRWNYNSYLADLTKRTMSATEKEQL